jgi:tape measure domain-containing protein
MSSPIIDTAAVRIVPDFSNFDSVLEGEIVEPLTKLDAQTEAIVKTIEGQFAEMAAELGGIFDEIRDGALIAFEGIEAQGEGVSSIVESEFASMGATVDAIFDEMRINADRDLDAVAAKSVETGGFVKGAFTAVAGAVTLGAGALAAGLGATALFGLKSAASLEQVNVALDSLTGSVAAGTKQFKQLQDFANTSPFEFNDLTTSAEKFDAFSAAIGQTKDDLTSYLTTVGNLVAETGGGAQALDSISLAFGQTASQGKLTLGNLEQINNAIPGFNAVAAIAAQRGITQAQALQQISAGTIDAKSGLNDLLKGMQQFPGAAGAMAKQANTLLGVFSTFHDVISQSLANAFAPVIPAVKASLVQLTPVIGDALNVIAPQLGKFISQLLPLIGNLVQALVPIIGPVLKALGDALTRLGPALVPLGDAFGKMLVALGPLVPVFADLAVKLIMALIPALLALTPLIIDLSNIFIPIANFISNHIDTFTALAFGFLAIVAAIKAYNLVMGIAKMVTEALTAVELALDAAMDANPLGLIVLAIAALAVGIIYLATKTQFFQTVWDAIWSFLKMVGAWFAGPFVDFFKAVGAWFAGPFLVPFLAIGRFFAGPFLDPFKAVGHFFSSTLVGWFKTAVDYVQSIPGRMLSALNSLVGKIYNVGHNIIQGLINGIENAGAAVWNSLKNIVSGALDKAKHLLGINSPSKVWMEVGGSVVEGFTKGIDDNADAPTGALSKMLAVPLSVTNSNSNAATTSAPLFGAGSIIVNAGAGMSQQDAYQAGLAVGQGVSDALTTRDARQQVRTM